MSSRMKENYKNNIVPALIKKFNYQNPMEVPKLDKIVINMGVGEAKENPKALEGSQRSDHHLRTEAGHYKG